MTRRRVYAAICLVSSIYTVDLTACAPSPSITPGLTDPTRRNPDAEDQWELRGVSRGTRLTVATRDSGTVVGRFEGFRQRTDDEYASRYASWLAGSDSSVTRLDLGAPVHVVMRKGADQNGTFAGYDFDVVRLRRDRDGKLRGIRLRDMKSLEGPAGVTVSSYLLTRWSDMGRLPLASVLVLEERKTIREISLEQVADIRVRDAPAVVGVVAVAGLLTLMVVIVAASRPRHTDPCGGITLPPTYLSLSSS